MKASKAKDVDSYIANAAKEAIPMLKELRNLIKTTVPKAEEGISWNVPFYKYNGALAGFSVFKKHVSFGLGSGKLDGADRQMLEKKGYRTAIRTISINFDQKIPITALKKILKAGAKTNEAKKKEL